VRRGSCMVREGGIDTHEGSLVPRTAPWVRTHPYRSHCTMSSLTLRWLAWGVCQGSKLLHPTVNGHNHYHRTITPNADSPVGHDGSIAGAMEAA
jgi:hypothetical protein